MILMHRMSDELFPNKCNSIVNAGILHPIYATEWVSVHGISELQSNEPRGKNVMNPGGIPEECSCLMKTACRVKQENSKQHGHGRVLSMVLLGNTKKRKLNT